MRCVSRLKIYQEPLISVKPSTYMEKIKKLTIKVLTLKPEKCEFNKKSTTLFGFVFLSRGISPDPEKVKAIHDASLPKTAKEVRSH